MGVAMDEAPPPKRKKRNRSLMEDGADTVNNVTLDSGAVESSGNNQVSGKKKEKLKKKSKGTSVHPKVNGQRLVWLIM